MKLPGVVITDIPFSIQKVGRQLGEVIGYPVFNGFYIHDPKLRVFIYVGNPNNSMSLLLGQTPYYGYRYAYVVVEGDIINIPMPSKPINKWFVPSNFVRDKLIKYGITNVDVIPHGVDTRLLAMPKPFEERRLFFYIAGYMIRKYPGYALYIYQKYGKDIDIITTPNNPYIKYFNVISDKAYSKNVTDDLIATQYASHRFYLNLSDTEGFGLTPLEACVYGCVPILPRIPVFTELYPSDLPIWVEWTGDTFNEFFHFEYIEHYVWDVEEMRNAIEYAKSMSKEEWEDKSQKCMEFAKQFDYRSVYKAFMPITQGTERELAETFTLPPT